MFKENDNMRPGPTPERLLAVCRLISQGSYTNQDIYKECALNEDADLNDEAIYFKSVLRIVLDRTWYGVCSGDGHYTFMLRVFLFRYLSMRIRL